MIGPVCPVCGEDCGYREIYPYDREARELWPPRAGMVAVARFQCRGARIGKTFSMLPWQLIPYHLYTVETILKVLLLWREYCLGDDISGTAYRVEQELPDESRVSSWQLRKWLLLIDAGFRAAQSELVGRYDFSHVSFDEDTPGALERVYAYQQAFSRGPPVLFSAVSMALRIYCQISGRFLFGRSSQGRGGACG